MKKTILLSFFLTCIFGAVAQDKVVEIASASASCYQPGNEVSLAIDGNTGTIWHSPWGSTPTTFPVTFTIKFKEATHVDYVRYTPRQDGNTNGNWDQVYVAYSPTTTGNDFTNIGLYSLNGSSASYDFILQEEGLECGQIRFTIQSGASGFASAAEIAAYVYDNSRAEAFAPYFSDALFTELNPEVTNSEGIEDVVVKQLVDNLLDNATTYKKFRVGEYEPYMTLSTLQKRLGAKNQYNRYENPTGIYLKSGETCFAVVSGIGNDPVRLTIKNWYLNESVSEYSLRNGLNCFTATSEGNVFVNYYTDNFENAPNVKIHFINAKVQGYWDQETMTNADWVEMLKGRSADDNTIIITRSKHTQLAYPVSAWLKYCPNNVDSTMTLYQQVSWALRDILGTEKYGLQTKNRHLYYATNYGFMAAGGEGAYCHVNSLGAIMYPDAAKFDFWGVGHEWGHNNQIAEGFHWSGCGETTNNIYASWAQFHFTGNRNASTGKPNYLRLEDETTGIGEYSNTRGGRMQTYFEEALRKGVAWQLQDGPDYHGATPEKKEVVGYDANGKLLGMVTTTSRNYDHFVKLVPFWQLNLWGTLAGKCPDIITMVIHSIRTTENYSSTYNTNGKKQVNWMKLACDSAKIDLLPFFEKAGLLRPINAYVEDYGAGWNIINEKMIEELKAYVKAQDYPAFSEEINYINGHNYHIYRDCLSLEVPEKLGNGCTLSGNKLKVQHNTVRNAVAFETYNFNDELLRITMYGLGSDDNHSYTQVLYPSGTTLDDIPAYVMAVGYDGTRKKIYENPENIPFKLLKEKLAQAKNMLTLIDPYGTNVGYYKPGSLDGLQELVDAIQESVDKEDTSVHSFSEWNQILENEMAALQANNDAKVPLFEADYYALGSVSQKNTTAEYSTAGLKVTFSDAAANTKKQWLFVPTGTGNQYYIQCISSGLYISQASEGARVKATAESSANAIAFNLVEAEPAHYYLQNAANTSLNLICDGSKNIVAAKNSTNSAQWTLTSIVDNHSEAMKAKLEGLFGMVDITLESLLSATEPELKFHEDITILDEQLPTYVAILLETYKAARKALEEEYAFLDAVYTKLAAAHEQVKVAFRKALYLPEATIGDEVMCYYLQCLSNEDYAYQFTGAGRYNGAIRTGELTDALDKNFWFYLRPGDTEGQYYIYNLATGKAAGASGRYLYINGTVDSVAYTIEVSTEEYGYIISASDGAWNVQSADNAYAQFTSKAAMWNLIPIGHFSLRAMGIKPTELIKETGIYYDLLGRPIENPAAGIYIHNGRKVIIK